jgi:long-chain acyl-CoA synthetase
VGLLHRASPVEADLTSLRNIASGGQALPVNLLDAIREACARRRRWAPAMA